MSDLTDYQRMVVEPERRALLKRVGAAEAQVAELREALEHYGNEDHWELQPDPRPEAVTKPYFPEWVYDGGSGPPWIVARAALASSTGEERPPLSGGDQDEDSSQSPEGAA